MNLVGFVERQKEQREGAEEDENGTDILGRGFYSEI